MKKGMKESYIHQYELAEIVFSHTIQNIRFETVAGPFSFNNYVYVPYKYGELISKNIRPVYSWTYEERVGTQAKLGYDYAHSAFYLRTVGTYTNPFTISDGRPQGPTNIEAIWENFLLVQKIIEYMSCNPLKK